ncbi:hypothetical protein WJX72_000260 [[Myrmecia] bisecta]|uniref:HTH three-helical bundle domain-containing protein n=1 Tax=[Myrmecia] bisecta TaxID=41462 RepID=A0AAW1P917_9CHLO
MPGRRPLSTQAEQGQQPNEEAQQGRQTQRAQRARQAQQALVASEPAPPAEQQAAGPLSKVEPTSSVRQRAREIVALLAAEGKPTPERVFRKALGNSADSSKALRWLLTQSHVSKEGRGGKSDPFTYTLTAAGLKSHQERMAE